MDVLKGEGAYGAAYGRGPDFCATPLTVKHGPVANSTAIIALAS